MEREKLFGNKPNENATKTFFWRMREIRRQEKAEKKAEIGIYYFLHASKFKKFRSNKS